MSCFTPYCRCKKIENYVPMGELCANANAIFAPYAPLYKNNFLDVKIKYCYM
jgi:hypothetical protein